MDMMTERVMECPHCGSKKLWKKGLSPGSHRQRYVCYDCGKSFYNEAMKRKHRRTKSLEQG